jgi:DNA-binding MarR family transcriptional regulator
MNTQTSSEQTLALAFAAAWNRLERRLDHSLGAIRGISLAEYRLLRALGDAPGSQASRVDLAQAVGLTPSGVTRALRPMEKLGIVSTVKSKRDAMEKLGIVSTVKSKRDARLAIAALRQPAARCSMMPREWSMKRWRRTRLYGRYRLLGLSPPAHPVSMCHQACSPGDVAELQRARESGEQYCRQYGPFYLRLRR